MEQPVLPIPNKIPKEIPTNERPNCIILHGRAEMKFQNHFQHFPKCLRHVHRSSPKCSQSKSRASKNIPRTSPEHAKARQNTPECPRCLTMCPERVQIAPNCPRASQSAFRASKKFPEQIHCIPEQHENMPEHLQSVPEHPWRIPKRSRTLLRPSRASENFFKFPNAPESRRASRSLLKTSAEHFRQPVRDPK